MLNRVGHSIRLAHLDGRRPCLQPRRPPHATSLGGGRVTAGATTRQRLAWTCGNERRATVTKRRAKSSKALPNPSMGRAQTRHGERATVCVAMRRARSSKASPPDPVMGSCGGATTSVATGHPARHGVTGGRAGGERSEGRGAQEEKEDGVERMARRRCSAKKVSRGPGIPSAMHWRA